MEGNGAQERIAGLQAIGGNLWEKNGRSRVYMNDLVGLYGLEVSRYNTGNISSALLRGERISNSRATKIVGHLAYAKLYWDVNAGAWGSRDLDPDYQADLVAEIETRLAGS